MMPRSFYQYFGTGDDIIGEEPRLDHVIGG